jgi:hypothetical protein
MTREAPMYRHRPCLSWVGLIGDLNHVILQVIIYVTAKTRAGKKYLGFILASFGFRVFSDLQTQFLSCWNCELTRFWRVVRDLSHTIMTHWPGPPFSQSHNVTFVTNRLFFHFLGNAILYVNNTWSTLIYQMLYLEFCEDWTQIEQEIRCGRKEGLADVWGHDSI